MTLLQRFSLSPTFFVSFYDYFYAYMIIFMVVHVKQRRKKYKIFLLIFLHLLNVHLTNKYVYLCCNQKKNRHQFVSLVAFHKKIQVYAFVRVLRESEQNQKFRCDMTMYACKMSINY